MKLSIFFLSVASASSLIKNFGYSRTILHSEMAVGNSKNSILFNQSSTVPASAPSIQLSDDVQILHSDTHAIIYYLNPSIADTSNHYNASFNMLLDTGSPLTWIYHDPSDDNTTCDDCSSPQQFVFNDSKPLKAESTFNLYYYNDEVEGNLYSLEDNSLTCSWGSKSFDNFTIGLTNDTVMQFDGLNMSGILGIPSNIDPNSNTNYLAQLQEEGFIDKKQFGYHVISAYLSSPPTITYLDTNNKTANLPTSYGGLVAFGSEADQLKEDFTGSSEWHFVNISEPDAPYWMINVTDISVTNNTGKSLPMNSSVHARKTIVDTGTTGIALPSKDTQQILELMFGNQVYIDENGYSYVACNGSGSISFSINGKQFNLTADEIRGPQSSPVAGSNGLCPTRLDTSGAEDTWIFGNWFLAKFYTLFDLENGRIGFADLDVSSYVLKQSTGSSSSSSTSSAAPTSSSATSSSSSSSKTNSTKSDGAKKGDSTKIQASLVIPGIALGFVIAMI